METFQETHNVVGEEKWRELQASTKRDTTAIVKIKEKESGMKVPKNKNG